MTPQEKQFRKANPRAYDPTVEKTIGQFLTECIIEVSPESLKWSKFRHHKFEMETYDFARFEFDNGHHYLCFEWSNENAYYNNGEAVISDFCVASGDDEHYDLSPEIEASIRKFVEARFDTDDYRNRELFF